MRRSLCGVTLALDQKCLGASQGNVCWHVTSTMSIPHFIFISPKPRNDKDPSLVEAWKNAVSMYFGEGGGVHFSIHQGYLREIDPALLRCDCMVSPANSFGIMDGG